MADGQVQELQYGGYAQGSYGNWDRTCKRKQQKRLIRLSEASRQIVRQLELSARAAALLSITREEQAAPGFWGFGCGGVTQWVQAQRHFAAENRICISMLRFL